MVSETDKASTFFETCKYIFRWHLVIHPLIQFYTHACYKSIHTININLLVAVRNSICNYDSNSTMKTSDGKVTFLSVVKLKNTVLLFIHTKE
jgi:hypothetical protein